MTTHGKLSIFRMTDTTDTEDNITDDKVEFDDDAAVPDNRSGLVSFTPVLSRTSTDNPAPFQEIARKPDTGFAGNRYSLNVFFDESDGNRALAIAKLRDFETQQNFIKGKFREGRIGLRNDYRPEFNVIPDNTAGYKLISFELTQELLHHTIIYGTIILEFSGDASRLGV